MVANIMGILIFVILILGSIALHEYGHMFFAKKFGVKVPEFMVGFGPKLWSKQRGETTYGVKAIPFGGYVKLVGMFPPAKEKDAEEQGGRLNELVESARQQSLDEIEPGEEYRAFYNLPIRKRIVVMAAGPLVNLVLALFLFGILLMAIGIPSPGTQLSGISKCLPPPAVGAGITNSSAAPEDCPIENQTPAYKAGLLPQDEIVEINNIPVENWNQIREAITSSGTVLTVEYLRNGVLEEKLVTPALIEQPVLDSDGKIDAAAGLIKRPFIGVTPGTTYERSAPWEMPSYMWDMTTLSLKALWTMPQRMYELGVTLATNGERSPESPVSVVGVSRLGGEIAATDTALQSKAAAFVGLAASLNFFLFLFNLLPLLPLDGGHIASAAYEGVRRKIAKAFGKADPDIVDTAKLIPLTYTVAAILLAAGLLVIIADVFKPITLG